jgi:hypothetical protein
MAAIPRFYVTRERFAKRSKRSFNGCLIDRSLQ